MEERWPSPIARTLVTNRDAAGAGPGLVRVRHHARIAERGALDGVLAGEGRTKE